MAVPVAVVAVGAAASAALLRGGDAVKPLPPEKQALLDKQNQRRVAAQAAPHAPKVLPKVASSCRRVLTPGIFQPRADRLEPNIVNAALVVGPDGSGYEVSAGALEGEPNQGVLIVRAGLGDACAWARAGEPSETHGYRLPPGAGAATITRLEGTVVVFRTASGDTGRFDAAMGQFR
jgi:hypothetical protein